jgi:hypothetical protein
MIQITARDAAPYQLALFSNGADGINFGAGVVWERRSCWRTKTIPLAKYLTPINAELFAISVATKEAGSFLPRTGHQRAEIVFGSCEALTAVSEVSQWVSPLVKDMKHHAEYLRQQGYNLMLSWLPSGEEIEGVEIAEQAASRVAQQYPQQIRSASLPYAK